MKLIVDMNLSPRWVTLLRDATIEAVHWSTIGAGDAPDTEIMAYAAKTKSIVLTHDLDFGAILAATHDAGPSVVQIRAENVSPDAIGGTVVEALQQMTLELTSGALVTVDGTASAYGFCRFHRPARLASERCPNRRLTFDPDHQGVDGPTTIVTKVPQATEFVASTPQLGSIGALPSSARLPVAFQP